MALISNEIKFIKSLQQKKFRDLHQLFVVEGVKLAHELFESENYIPKNIYHTEDFEVPPKFKDVSTLISSNDLSRISGLQSPNKVLITVPYSEAKVVFDHDSSFILLDTINDPGNLGTIMRSADWFGINQIIANINSTDQYNPKVIQASMGAIFRIKLQYADLKDELPKLKSKNYAILGADMNGENLFEYKFPQKFALLMGSESHGINQSIKNNVDTFITIPKFGTTESLNVGVACSIILSYIKAK